MKKRVRVFMVGMSEHVGGIETYIANLCNKLADSRFEIIYNMPRMEIEGKIWIRPLNRHHFIKYYKFWKCFFYSNRFDVIYYNTCDIVSIDMLYFAKMADVPIRIIHSHCANDDWKLNFFQRLQEKYSRKNLDKFATHLFACSEEAGKWMFGSRNYSIIKNGIDYSKYQFNNKFRNKCRSELLLTDEMLIGVIGRLVKSKNPFYCMDIFEKILEKAPNAKMVYIGDGEYKEELEKQVKEKQFEGKIYFLGSRKDVNEWISAIDCLLMPSLFEGLPFVLVEAQAAGLPCVVSSAVSEEADLTGLVEFIDLTEKTEVWADKILEACHRERLDTTQQLIDAGYSIAETAKTVSEIIEKSLEKA